MSALRADEIARRPGGAVEHDADSSHRRGLRPPNPPSHDDAITRLRRQQAIGNLHVDRSELAPPMMEPAATIRFQSNVLPMMV